MRKLLYILVPAVIVKQSIKFYPLGNLLHLFNGGQPKGHFNFFNN